MRGGIDRVRCTVYGGLNGCGGIACGGVACGGIDWMW